MDFGFDFMAQGIGGVQLAAIVFGIVEFVKSLFPGLSGKWVNVLAVLLGSGATVLFMVFPTFSEAVQFWVTVAVVGAGGGLAAGGWYSFVGNQVKKLQAPVDGNPGGDGLG